MVNNATSKLITPKVFISYSWSSPEHQSLVREWAERLRHDGVDVILDQYDLKAGQDKYEFMERMVTDKAVTHVLVFADKKYKEKADNRKAGVGTETQIISKEVYDKVTQSKFVPIKCEPSDDDSDCFPVFFQARIGFDFSSPQKVNEDWEPLLRHLFGKPLHEKPKLGNPPAYIISDSNVPSSPAIAKYSTLRQAILQGKNGIGLYRREFLESCFEHVESIRNRDRGGNENAASKIVEECGKLVQVRDYLIDWMLLESEAAPSKDFSNALIELLERLLALRDETSGGDDVWPKAYNIFSYETFLYTVAALLKNKCFTDLRAVFSALYIKPAEKRLGGQNFQRFDSFYTSCSMLNAVLAKEGAELLSPTAQLIKLQAKRSDIPFLDLLQADLLILLISFIDPQIRWYPQSFFYARYAGDFPFFLKATHQKGFENLSTIIGTSDLDAIRLSVKKGSEEIKSMSHNSFYLNLTFWDAINMDKLNTIK